MTRKNRKKYEISCFEVLAGCSLLRAEGCSCSLVVLYGDLGVSKIAIFVQKNKKLIFSYISLNFWSP
jgi:hypothetical protein